MNFCKLILTIFSLTFVLRIATAGQDLERTATPTNASTSEDEQQIISAARTRANACASGDAQTWATFVDENFRDIEGNATASKKQIMDECRQAARAIPGHKIERLVSDFHFQFVANIALVDYVYEYKDHYGEIILKTTFHQVDTYEKRQGKWLAVLAVSVAVIPDPPVARVDSASLDDFTGEYASVGSWIIDTVTRKGDKLYVQSTGEDSPTELLAESADTFFVRGGGIDPQARVAFVRDKSGRVTGERVYGATDGQGYNTRKIK
jgi:Domain of unknown function (DUF3471)